jgi:hypothetical protein
MGACAPQHGPPPTRRENSELDQTPPRSRPPGRRRLGGLKPTRGSELRAQHACKGAALVVASERDRLVGPLDSHPTTSSSARSAFAWPSASLDRFGDAAHPHLAGAYERRSMVELQLQVSEEVRACDAYLLALDDDGVGFCSHDSHFGRWSLAKTLRREVVRRKRAGAKSAR